MLISIRTHSQPYAVMYDSNDDLKPFHPFHNPKQTLQQYVARKQ